MRSAGLNLVGVKETNRTLLLQLICTSGQITRSQLSERSHLSPMTVTNIVNEFMAMGIVEEATPQDYTKAPGRTPMLLKISPVSPVIVGVFVTKACLYGAVGDLSLNLLGRLTLPLDTLENDDSILYKMRLLVDKLIGLTDRPILGLGVSTAGIVDPEHGSIRYITDFYHIKHLNIREYLSLHFSFPIYVYNDMQASGLCELYFGYGQTQNSFLYVGITNGLGAAVVTHRELLDSCGEIGHMSIDTSGPRCTCGSNGCLELYTSTPNILKRISEECGVTLPDMEQAAKFAATNKTAYTVFYNATQQLSYGINNFLNLINVSTVVLGHDAFFLPDELIANMTGRIARMNVAMHRRNDAAPRFVKSKFGANTPLFGSLCVILQQVFLGNCCLGALPPHGAQP